MKTSSPYTLGGFLITLLGAIMFSTKAIFVKLAFRYTPVDAVSLLALRMLLSMPFYLLAAWLAYRRTGPPITRRQFVYICAMGLMGYYISSLFQVKTHIKFTGIWVGEQLEFECSCTLGIQWLHAKGCIFK
jgi:hypothetical protein